VGSFTVSALVLKRDDQFGEEVAQGSGTASSKELLARRLGSTERHAAVSHLAAERIKDRVERGPYMSPTAGRCSGVVGVAPQTA
jgi:hypothetical protein